MKYLLKLTRLDFISPVDAPAQETAKVLLIKRKGEVDGRANVVKISEELGLVFCWAFTSKAAGADYYDLHGDKIDEDFVAAAASFMERGGVTDEMHDGSPDGRVVFAMPMTPDIAKAFGVQTDTVGLMVALKPSPEVFAKFKSGEYTGVSIQGMGERVEARKGITVPVEIDASAASAALDDLLVKAQAIEAALGKSTQHSAPAHGGDTMETLEAANQEIETLKAKIADLEKRAAMSPEDRQAEIEKSDPVAYRGEVSGITVRKSEATSFALALAKAHEAQAVALAKAEADTLAEVAKREMVELKKRAADALPNFAGTDDTRAALYKAAELIGDDAVKALKGYESVATLKTETAGIEANAEQKPQPSEQEQLDALISEEMAKSKSEKPAATAAVLNTKAGADLYAAVQKRIKSKKTK